MVRRLLVGLLAAGLLLVGAPAFAADHGYRRALSGPRLRRDPLRPRADLPRGPVVLDLLTRTRTLTLRHGAVLSVAIEQLELVPGTQEVASRLVRNYHDLTRPYLRLIAARVDQVAVMTYDTGLPADWLDGVVHGLADRAGRPTGG
jgi:hypothetical protein